MAQPIYQLSTSPIVSSGIGVEKILDKTITINPDSYVDLDFDKAIQTKELDIIYIYISDYTDYLAFSLIRELETGIIQEQFLNLYGFYLYYFIRQMGVFQMLSNSEMPATLGDNPFILTNTKNYKLRIYNAHVTNQISLTIKIWLERQL